MNKHINTIKQLTEIRTEAEVETETDDNSGLAKLFFTANKERYRHNPEKSVTYLIDRNINFTNVCDTACRFCAFHRKKGHGDNYVISFSELCHKITPLLAAGGSRILLQGGHNPDLKLDWYLSLLSNLKKEFPELELDCFSPAEIHDLCQRERLEPETVLKEMQTAGLSGLPGGGAEILHDELRAKICPNKVKSDDWLHIMSIAHRLNLNSSCTMVIGFGEDENIRKSHLQKLEKLQKESLSQGFRAFNSFILWTFQYEHTELKHTRKRKVPVFEYLKTLATARIMLQSIKHVQASWPTMGTEIAQLALFCGADDFGSTMFEENVVSSAGAKQKTHLTEAEIRLLITEAGFKPQKRRTDYSNNF